MLQYFESQGLPSQQFISSDGQACLTLRGGTSRQQWIRLPWAACNGATEWLVHLNPKITADLKAYSEGGNIQLDLSGMQVSRVTAETGGGGIEMRLPDGAADLFASALTGAGNVTINIGLGLRGSSAISASSGAGNVSVFIPDGLPARIHTSTGMGKVLIDPLFSKTNGVTYQTRSFEEAVNKVEITLKSGMGNVIVRTK